MTLIRFFSAGAAALVLSASALFAGDIMVKDPYVRSSTPSSITGAAFLTLVNHSDTDDRLIAARTDVAKRAEHHTHKEDANGVMKMLHVEDGFELPAEGEIAMKRGGKHVMLMGLTNSLNQGDTISVTLEFEKAGDVVVNVPVDLERQDHGHMTQGSDS